ncbi:hypothetical protein [Hymenobacter sp. AT01-02]|uniref:ABC transporter permease n=1 Tax=Hymenobacter sp. AT01-02 TaxID=1571877 RepID=UPI0029344C82|nr:hypothetical protein [Hymenobacter sp. AT01-02]
MHLLENIKEAFRSINSNLLRTILTALIVSIGIMALVGILTAIDAMKYKLNSTFASLGANSFEIKAKGTTTARVGEACRAKRTRFSRICKPASTRTGSATMPRWDYLLL